MPYEAVPGFFHGIPAGDYLGELQGIATNSKGHIFAFFRGPNSRLWEFDQTGKFIKEIGKGFYGFQFAHSVRVDRHDNIWTVDEGTNVVTKFDPTGTKVLMVVGHRPSQAEGPMPPPKAAIRRTRNTRYAGLRMWPGTSRTTSSSATATATTGWSNTRPKANSWPKTAPKRSARARMNITCRTACRWITRAMSMSPTAAMPAM